MIDLDSRRLNVVDIENPREIRAYIRAYRDELSSLVQNACLVMTVYLIVMVTDGACLYYTSAATPENPTYNYGTVVEFGFVVGAIALTSLIVREYRRLQRGIAAFTELNVESDFFRNVLLIPIEIEITQELIENRYRIFILQRQRALVSEPEFFQV